MLSPGPPASAGTSCLTLPLSGCVWAGAGACPAGCDGVDWSWAHPETDAHSTAMAHNVVKKIARQFAPVFRAVLLRTVFDEVPRNALPNRPFNIFTIEGPLQITMLV